MWNKTLGGGLDNVLAETKRLRFHTVKQVRMVAALAELHDHCKKKQSSMENNKKEVKNNSTVGQLSAILLHDAVQIVGDQ